MPISKAISKARPGHPSLDFDLLRAEGIRHLENFATELWTDYNTHDPGITLLELLCYGITDLGYRTRMLPVEDLMANPPGNNSQPWFTAADVLPGSPVTALDYRKLMIDVEGVKNAWIIRGEEELKLSSTGIQFPGLYTGDKIEDGKKIKEIILKYWNEIPGLRLPTGEDGVPSLGNDIVLEISDGADIIFTVDENGIISDADGKIYTEDDSGNIVDAAGNIIIDKDDVQKKVLPELAIEVFNQIKNKISLIGSLLDCLPYITAIGGQAADLDKLAKLEIQKVLGAGKVSQEQLDVIYDYILRFPNDSELPKSDDIDEEESNVNKLYSDLFRQLFPNSGPEDITADKLQIGVIEYFWDSENSEDDYGEKLNALKQHENIKEYFLGTLVGKLSGAALKAYKAIPQSGPASLGELGRKRRHLLQEVYKKITNQPNISKLDAVIALFEEKAEYGGFFSTLSGIEKNDEKWFYDGDRWVVKERAIDEFLKNTFFIPPPSQEGSRDKNEADGVNEETGAVFAVFLPPDGRPPEFSELVLKIKDYHDNLSPAGRPKLAKDAAHVLDYLSCKYGLWGVGIWKEGDERLPLSGLYSILLDLDENIDAGIPNLVDPIVEKVKEKLHKNRGLCEDFVDIRIVEQRPIGVCLHIEVAPEADEVDIFAEAIRLMQEYLSPVPRFRTFAQRLKELKAQGRNYSAEHIFNGPLLCHGFLEDAELGDNRPRSEYYYSDLLREVMSVDGVVALPVLKVDEAPEEEDAAFAEKSEYLVYTNNAGEETKGEFPHPASLLEPGEPAPPYCKPVIDLDRCSFRVTKGARTFSMNKKHIEERLELLRLIHFPDPLGEPGGPEWKEGTFRPDLSDYRSLQYDLPATYTVGDNPPPGDAPLKRQAQSRHLQAYLAYYDQMLASYLAQLGQVRRLLSVDQKADAPTRVMPLLYEVPGMRELIGVHAPFTAEPADWNVVIGHIPDSLVSVTDTVSNPDRKNDRDLAAEKLATLRAGATAFSGLFGLREKLAEAFAPASRLAGLYSRQIEDYFWAKYTADEQNYHVGEIKKLAESPADQQRRMNRLLDHLIARFGEAFSAYAAALLRPEAEPEDNPRQQTFGEYLEAKADFLREIAGLARERNKGYNYRAYNEARNVADIWNTANVSGLQKRVVRKLGIPSWEARSLIAEPAYRIDIVQGSNRRGMANYRAALRRRLKVGDATDNPQEAVPLMISPAYSSSRLAQDKIDRLYQSIWQARHYEESEAAEDDIWFRLLSVPGGKFRAALVKKYIKKEKGKSVTVAQGGTDIEIEVLLESEPLSEDEAKDRIIDEVIPLVRPARPTKEHEGFHIVEHILLRPLEADDPLLQIPLGCVLEEAPKDPYSFWLTVVAPAETTRFSDPDFRAFFEHEFRLEMPAHLAVRFCYLDLDGLYAFEEAFAIWMFEKARCNPPDYCRVDVAAARLVELLNALPCSCACKAEEPAGECSVE